MNRQERYIYENYPTTYKFLTDGEAVCGMLEMFCKIMEGYAHERHLEESRQLRHDLETAHMEIGRLIDDPNGPEAAVIKTRWYFEQEVKKSMDTGNPPDVPKLMGLVGKMLYPDQIKKAKDGGG